MPASREIEIKRHCHKLSGKKADDVIQTVADLIVTFLKSHGNPPDRPPVNNPQEPLLQARAAIQEKQT